MSCYELREAIRQAASAVEGSPWTGKLEKHEVQRAIHRLIEIAERIDRENEQLVAKLRRTKGGDK